MSELAPPGGVPDGEDPAVGGQEGAVGADALPVMGDPGHVEVKPLQGGGPADRNEEMRSGDPDLIVP